MNKKNMRRIIAAVKAHKRKPPKVPAPEGDLRGSVIFYPPDPKHDKVLLCPDKKDKPQQ